MKMITGRSDLESEARQRFEGILNDTIKHPSIGRLIVKLKSDGSFVGHSKLKMAK
jgi:hypothetical protein